MFSKALLEHRMGINALKEILFATSLVVQWIKTHLPMQEHRLDPWSGKIPHAVGQLSACPQLLSLPAAVTEAHKP